MIGQIRARPYGFTPQRSINPNFGQGPANAVRQLADTGFSAALQIYRTQNSQKDNEAAHRSARIEAVEQLGKARVDFDLDPDTMQLGERFEARSKEIRAAIAERFGDDQAALDRFNADYEAVSAPHAVGVYRRQQSVRQQTDTQSLESDLNALLEQFGTATDDQAREAIQDQAAGFLSRAREAQLISEAEMKTGLERFSESAVEAQALGLLREDPAGLKRLLEAGALPNIGPAQAQRLLTRAEAELEQRRIKAGETERRDDSRQERDEREQRLELERAERAIVIQALSDDPARLIDRIDAGEFATLGGSKPDEVARYRVAAERLVRDEATRLTNTNIELAETRLDGLTEEVDLAEKALDAGRPVPISAQLIADTTGTPLEGRVASVLDASAALDDFRTMTPERRTEALARTQATTPTNEIDIKRFELMQDLDATLRKSELADIVAHHETHLGRPFAPVDFGDPASLLSRQVKSERAASNYNVPFRFFSEDELRQVSDQIKDGNPDSQLALITSMTSALGERAVAPLAELGLKDEIFGYAGIHALQTGDPTVARAMLAGRAALKDGTAKKASQTIRDRAIRETEAFEALPGAQSEARSRLLQAANLHFAATAQEADFDVTDDANTEELTELYTRSLQLVAGARFQGEVQFGGIQEVGRLSTLLPSTLSGEQVETALDDISADLLQQASTTGARPTFGGGPMPDELTRQISIRWVGGNLYQIGHVRRMRFEALGDDAEESGRALFDLEKLVRLAERAKR